MTDEELELFPTSESAQRMLSYVTAGFYDKSYVGKWLFQVMGIEYDEALKYAEELPLQMFPETATWGLKYHEIKWNLPVRENLSYEERRRAIYQKRDNRAPMTPYTMETYLKNITGFDVFVADAHDAGPYGYVPEHPNVFKVFFSGEGTVNTAAARKKLEQIKQSHTVFSMNYWTAYEIDQKSLEKILLRDIRIALRVPFWKGRLLDGSELLDGTKLLDGYVEYNARVGLIYREGAFETHEAVNNARMEITAEIRLNEAYKLTGQIINFAVFYWSTVFLDGGKLLNGKTMLNATRQPIKATAGIGMQAQSISERYDNACVTIRKNLAYFDGSLRLDGQRKLDSINRKEAI